MALIPESSASSFARRIAVILRCSAAAISSSSPGAFGSRSRSSSSISAAVLPVAQTMKMWPKRASYSRLPRSSASSTSSPAPATPPCSAADQPAVAGKRAASEARSPMRGWWEKASSQSSRPSDASSRSAAASSDGASA